MSARWMSILRLVALLICVFTQTVRADLNYEEESTDRGMQRVYKMTISPAAEPVPALQNRLTVQPHETIPGNAITHYLRSYGENSLDAPWKAAREKYDDVHQWYSNEIAIKDLPLDNVRDVSEMFDTYVNSHIARATICRFVDWGLAEEDLGGLEAIEFLLPSVQQTRSVSRALSLRTRLAIADGRYDDAIDHMRMNYRLAENVGEMKFLVASLVGIAEVSMANQTMADFVASTDSPNMYWALAELPRPIIDLRNALRLEMSFGLRLIPELQDVETAQHTQQEWASILQRTSETAAKIATMYSREKSKINPLQMAAIGLASFPAAKQRLIDAGMNELKVSQMPVAQVLLIDMAREYRRYADEFEKSAYVPFRDSRSVSAEAERQLRKASGKLELGALLANALLPAVSAVRNAQIRVQWHRNALQNIEAIRMHLAETGKLPRSLQEITCVPLLVDPYTGQEMLYSCDGKMATIELPFGNAPGYAVRFELQVADND